MAGLWAAEPARADDFGQSVTQTLSAAGPSIKTSLKAVGSRKPQAPVPSVKLNFDSNVPAEVRRQMGRDLAFVGAIVGSGATKLHEQVFGKVNGAAYIKWFTSRVKAVGLDEKEKDPSTVAYVIDGPKMWLTENYVKWSQPQIERLDTIFHEARHTEPNDGGWPHVTCPTPFKDEQGQDVKGIISGHLMAGLEACDDTPVGAYGIAAIMLKNIQSFCAGQSCTKKVRMDAGLYGDDDVKRIIGEPAARELKTDLYP